MQTTPARRLRDTVSLIGAGIRAASEYQPLRLHAAQLASRAPWKDYRAQLAEIYRDFLGRWSYVRDPAALETVATTGPAVWGVVAGSYNRDPRGKGHGDCDDATVYIGATARAIGLPVRIVTMSPPGALSQSHVYAEVHIPREGWTPIDPVAHPKPFGTAPPAGSRIFWDLYGHETHKEGGNMSPYENYTAGLGALADTADPGWEVAPLEAFGLAGLDAEEPEDLSTVIRGFGQYADTFGVLEPSTEILGEVQPDATGYALTPIMELSLGDYTYTQITGSPYVGMLALGLDGETYQYQTDGLGRGFFKRLRKKFKKLRKKIRRGVKKAFSAVKKFAKKIIKKIPGGKYLIKVAQKMKKIALKMVKPLAKLVGKAAPFLAKVAAFVPGYGTAIAAGLYAAGKVANVINKVGAKVDKIKNKLVFPGGGAQALAFKQELAREAKAMAQATQRERARNSGRRLPPPRRIAGLNGYENELVI